MKIVTQVGMLRNKQIFFRKYLYFSTLLGVFSGAVRAPVGFDLQMFDVVMVINLILMASFITLPRWVAWLAFYITASATIGIFRGTDTLVLSLKQFLGITISALYFYNFFKFQGNNVDRIFSTYIRVAYWVTIIGFFTWAGNCLVAKEFVRMHSILTEPMHYCTLVLPAYYWYAHCFIFGKNKKEFFVISIGMCLAASSIGFLGIAFGLALLFSRKKVLLLAVPLIVSVLLGTIYSVSSNFRLRMNDTILALTASEIDGVNISTYALVSNMFVTEKVLQEHPLIGNGIGSHPKSHDVYLADIPSIQSFIDAGEDSIGAKDASSLTLRVLSELGLIGFLGVLWFLWHFRVRGNGKRAAISNAILVCFFVKLLRSGHYFQPEQFFFIQMYILNYRQEKQELSRGTAIATSLIPTNFSPEITVSTAC